jgi:hypothetical protein
MNRLTFNSIELKISLNGKIIYENKFINFLNNILYLIFKCCSSSKFLFIGYLSYQFVSYHRFKPKSNLEFEINGYIFKVVNIIKVSPFEWEVRWASDRIGNYTQLANFYYHNLYVVDTFMFERVREKLEMYFKLNQENSLNKKRNKKVKKDKNEVKIVKFIKI